MRGALDMQFGFIIPAGPDKNGREASHPQEWQRAGVKLGWAGKNPYPSRYTPTPTREAEKLVGQYTMVAMRKNDIRKVTSGPLEITTVFFFNRTPTQEAAKVKLPFPSITPDVDNLAKLVLDGMNKVLYTDDAKVVQLTAFKRYTHREAHTFVGVRSLEDHEAQPPWDVYEHLAWCKEFYPHNDW